MCEVFEARRLEPGLDVAVKILRPELVADTTHWERLRVESDILARLSSPHIVRCYHRGVSADGRPFIVLERLRGPTVHEILALRWSLHPAVAARLGSELLSALVGVHALGAVHRDVQPQNVIVHQIARERAILKLIDFGLAFIRPDAHPGAPARGAFPTDPDTMVGTPRFMSPEAITGATALDGRADLYSVGALLYAMIAGSDPFGSTSHRARVWVSQRSGSRPPCPPRQ